MIAQYDFETILGKNTFIYSSKESIRISEATLL